jgi:hypothetical protein
MQNKQLFLVTLLVAGCFTRLTAQDHTADIINTTLSKMNTIKRDYRVIEKTVGDVLFQNDTSADNRIFSYGFSSSKRYHLNAFAPSTDISSIAIAIYMYDSNNKLQLVTRNETPGTDVTLNFDPRETKTYYLIVSGSLRQNIQSSFFNLIIDRD